MSIALLALLGSIPFAQNAELKCFDLQVGQVGRFPEQDNFNFFTVYRVLSPSEMVVGLANFRSPLYPPPGSRFLLRGVPTANMIDGKRIDLKAIYSVTGTKKVSGQTMAVVELAEKDPEKAAAETLRRIKDELRQLLKDYPKTKAAGEAKKILEAMAR